MQSARSATDQGASNEPLLSVSGLETQFETYRGIVEALDGVQLSVGENETVGIVGESR